MIPADWNARPESIETDSLRLLTWGGDGHGFMEQWETAT